jgi:hypothetical protein
MITALLLQLHSRFSATVEYHSYQEVAVKQACPQGDLFGLPPWYEYLQTPKVDGKFICTPYISGINDFWLIGLAVIEIMLRIAVFVAIGFVVYGGAKYITARGYNGQGGPDKLNSAKLTVYDALTGLMFAVVAAAVVSFIGGRFSQ